jgi:DNA (cytosine-5)-methyltransferase 1
VDVVVGSPPCTQFSFSNRGGTGDIADGLVDIEKFLEIVAFLKPRFWAMENVPRVKDILDVHLATGGLLARFKDLRIKSMVVDMSEFGLPQRRRRCIAGNFDFKLLLSYRQKCERRTLGEVLKALAGKMVIDPIYGVSASRAEITDHEPEPPLNEEEERMNRESKMFHPVYNNMAFPDPKTSPVRTITATCTRVSRESVVIRAPENPKILRRLTVRERASLQGFPISYQFFGASYAQKLKLVGNAIPPLMTFYIAQAMRGVSPESLDAPAEGISEFKPTAERPLTTIPDGEGQTYPTSRTFRAAIPNLRFKSGVRFEIANEFEPGTGVTWDAHFYFGNSKDIRECILDKTLLTRSKQAIGHAKWGHVAGTLANLLDLMKKVDGQTLQDVWSHRVEGMRPFVIVDAAGAAAGELISEIKKLKLDSAKVESFVLDVLGLKAKRGGALKAKNGKKGRKSKVDTSRKVRRFALPILAGFIVGATLNQAFAQVRSAARKLPRHERLVA